jgi:hypothetical protein
MVWKIACEALLEPALKIQCDYTLRRLYGSYHAEERASSTKGTKDHEGIHLQALAFG